MFVYIKPSNYQFYGSNKKNSRKSYNRTTFRIISNHQ